MSKSDETGPVRQCAECGKDLYCTLGLCMSCDNARLEKENKRLRDAIGGALRIKDLWLPQSGDPEHEGEVVALSNMSRSFTEALTTEPSPSPDTQEESRPLRKALEFMALQACCGVDPEMDCTETSDCITEWCLPCHARGVLKSSPPPDTEKGKE